MSTQYTDYPVVGVNRKFSWSGIFSGTFLYLAIEATFGVLGVAIFTSAMNPHSANPIGRGLGVGAGIWMVVLSIIALYFAGKLASTHSAATTRNAGMYAGLVTFGMSVFATFLIAAMAFGSSDVVRAGVSGASITVMDFIIVGGYWLFAAMLLGAIGAACGGIHGSMTTGGIRTVERTTTDTSKRIA